MKMTKVFENKWITFMFLNETCVGRTHNKDDAWMVACLDPSGTTFHLMFHDIENPVLSNI